jgi:hypothetical protein
MLKVKKRRKGKVHKTHLIVHKKTDFVHFIWLCAQKVVPLQAFLKYRYSILFDIGT